MSRGALATVHNLNKMAAHGRGGERNALIGLCNDEKNKNAFQLILSRNLHNWFHQKNFISLMVTEENAHSL